MNHESLDDQKTFTKQVMWCAILNWVIVAFIVLFLPSLKLGDWYPLSVTAVIFSVVFIANKISCKKADDKLGNEENI